MDPSNRKTTLKVPTLIFLERAVSDLQKLFEICQTSLAIFKLLGDYDVIEGVSLTSAGFPMTSKGFPVIFAGT